VPGFWEVAYPPRKGRPLPPPSAAVWYLDLGKTRKGEALVLAQGISERFYRELGRSPAIGLGSSKFSAAAIARRARPGQPRAIPPGGEAAFLAGQPVTLLPLDAETLRRLHLLGLHTLGQLAALPPGALAAQFGQTGRQMAQLAQGHDDRPVAAIQTQAEESITLELHGAVEDGQALATILHTLAADLAARLEKRNYTARRLEVSFHLDDGGQKTTRTTLRQPTHDPARLSREFVRLLNRPDLPCGVVAVTVTARDLHTVEWRQLNLFGTQLDADDRLRQLVAALTPRFGGDPLYRVRAGQREHRLVEGRYRFDPAGVA
jgi:protein ImuB